MALIKRAEAETAANEALVLDLGELHRHGLEMTRRAEEEAQRIVADAKAERERLISTAAEEGRKKGFDAGHASGYEAGLGEGRAQAAAARGQELGELLNGWTGALQQFLDARDDLLLVAKQDVVRLAVLAAERVTHRQIAVDPRSVAGPMRVVLERVVAPSRLVLLVHPEDLEIAQEVLPTLIGVIVNAEHVEVRGDIGLARGSCVLQTAGGAAIDASIDSQLRRIAEELLPGSSELLGAEDPAQQSPEDMLDAVDGSGEPPANPTDEEAAEEADGEQS